MNILYGGDGCPSCDAAKKYLDALDIEYEYVDIRKDKETTEKFLEEFGVRTIPVFKTDNGTVVGFKNEEYKKIL